MERGILICKVCGYETSNKKSYSNHIRNGCPSIIKMSNLHCKHCGSQLKVRKPSEKYLFCDRKCYALWINCNSAYSGKNAHRYKNGESKTRLYHIWLGMKRRCLKINCKDYHNYGGRGIVICDEWMNDFLQFKEWSYINGYDDNLTIERIDVNIGYNPKNCTWIPNSEQSKNRRNVKKRYSI